MSELLELHLYLNSPAHISHSAHHETVFLVSIEWLANSAILEDKLDGFVYIFRRLNFKLGLVSRKRKIFYVLQMLLDPR